ncbi:28 kDa heat- and acid-stable phosphoprotein [Cloeon dipterum]|uniref:Casein kinase substrate phosphoprotein PP28 domain-containing protein n=1 Tax=Cloeon dipterum TaxID=197152 RepID=A0A8S1C995_9INSE|nr:Hypothetical predicted protein [Cloeon dipterum]
MPRGKYVNHKGKNRRFNNPEEINEQMEKEKQKREWREKHGADPEEDSAEEKGSGSEAGSDDSSSDGEEEKAKGVQHLIEVENPNRVQKKTKKVTELNTEAASSAPQLSRREREEIEKERARANYQRLHAQGKTDEARADLARLAIIRQQREDAARRREMEVKEREAAAKAKTDQTSKALGKKK